MPIDPAYLHLVYPGQQFDCFLYGRNSVDPKKKGRSVGDQLEAGQQLADEHGWPVKGVFRDTGLSASRHARKKRDEFEDMLDRIENREARIVVAFEASRYYRDLGVYVQLRDVCHSAGVLLCYNGQVYDLSKRADRKTTAMDAVGAEDELEGIRDRNLRTATIWAAKGAPHGPTPYGYRRNYDPATGDLLEQVPDPHESKLVRHIFREVNAGKSQRGLARWLNEKGETTRLGNPWGDRSVNMLLRNKAYIGKRVHNGVVREGTWKGLVSPKLFDQVQDILDGRANGAGASTAVKYLLSGLALCGLHEGAQIRDHYTLKKTTTSRGRWIYRCGSLDLSINADLLEAYVEEGLVEWMSSKEAAEAFRKPKDSQAAARAKKKLASIERQLKEARKDAARFDEEGEPVLSAASLAALEKSLRPMAREAEAELKRANAHVPALLEDLLGNPKAAKVWEALDLHQQRFVISQVVTVRLFKARAPGVKSIEPGRVTLSFYGQDGFVKAPRGGSKA